MKCPFCNAEDTRVIDSRPADENTAIRRRRQCEVCGKRFTTFEKTETLPFMVVKKDQSHMIELSWRAVFYDLVINAPFHRNRLRSLWTI